ncbi:MAG: hypothetical protein INQ03_05380 [Candidatus Heimdallarchaeota archaeon]|nr:hypothetical protein [Candidatus Heimdallarchaeota archaeon]
MSKDEKIPGSKKIKKGFIKAASKFNEKLAEGATKANIAHETEDQTLDKVVSSVSEFGKSVVEGTIQGTKEGAPDIISGVSDLAGAIGKKIKDTIPKDEEE